MLQIGCNIFSDTHVGLPAVYATLSGLTTNPTFGSTAEIGAPLTAAGVGGTPTAYQWATVESGDLVGETAALHTPVAANDTEQLYCKVTIGAQVYNTPAYTIRYAPATVTALPSLSATGAAIGDTITFAGGTWSNATGGAFSRIWYRDGVAMAPQPGLTYTIVAGDDLATIEAEQIYTNSGGTVVATSNAIIIDDFTAPVISGVPTIAGTTTEGQTLTATLASVTGNPVPTSTYQWQRNDGAAGAWQDIAGATAQTRVLTTADAGYRIRVVQTSTNAMGSDTASSAQTAIIATAPAGPTASSVSAGAQDAAGNVPITVTGLSADSPNSKWILTTAQQTSLTKAQVVAGTDENDAAATDAGSASITTASPSFDATLKTGLDASFYLYVVFGDSGSNYSATPYEVGPIAIDTTNPVFNAVTGTQTGQTTADWTATSNEAGGTIYAAVRLAANPVLAKADIVAGTGNAVATSTDATPTADANNGGSFAGLTAGTAYQVDAYHDDGTGNTSAVASSSSFTTAAAGASVVEVQAVEVINSTTVTTTFNGSSITIGSGANRALVLEVMGYNDLGTGAKGAASVTHNGQPATLFKSGNNGAKNWAEHWIILNPTAGAGTTTVVTNANQEGIGVVARELNNVDQVTPTPGTGNGGNGTGVGAPVTLTTLNANSLIIGSLSIEGGNAGTVTGTNGATSLLQNASGAQGFADITFGSAIESVAAASADGFDFSWPTSKKFQWIASEIKAA